MDYKEYSRLRSIARKRIERAAAAGRGEYIRLPTVAEVKTSANPAQYMNAVRSFVENPYATLSAAKRQNAQLPKIELGQLPPVKKVSKLSPEAKRARRNEQKRRSKAKRAVERSSQSEAEARKKVGYLRALETVSKKWREAGLDIGHWLGVLSPKKAKSFVDYMEYRFSQGDYNNRYTIDTFIRDFGELVKRNYNFDDIEGDFSRFLVKQKTLGGNMRRAKKYGITEDEIDSAWRLMAKEI